MIQEVSLMLEELLKNELYPEVLTSRDAVSLCVPRHENQDYMVGIYLYDINEDGTQRISYAKVTDGKRIYPDRNMTLSYVIYINEDTRFGGYRKDMETLLLERLIQIFHDTSSMLIEGHEVMLQFEQVTMENKIRFWTSLNKPLQPSLYVKISPVAIASRKTETVPRVRDVNIAAEQKEDTIWR